MKLGFAKFLMVVALGVTVSAWGGAALSSAEAPAESPAQIEVRILETAMHCEVLALTAL